MSEVVCMAATHSPIVAVADDPRRSDAPLFEAITVAQLLTWLLPRVASQRKTAECDVFGGRDAVLDEARSPAVLQRCVPRVTAGPTPV
jgi:hypothetical protein